MIGRHRQRLSALGGCYRVWPRASDACAYCGVYGVSYDHVPPLTKVYDLGPAHFESANIKLYLVPCCIECNSLLCRFGGDTVTERKRFVKKRLRTRYAKFLKQTSWTDEEIAVLGYNLRTLIETGVSIGEFIRRRLAW